jgi:hypothetical protein
MSGTSFFSKLVSKLGLSTQLLIFLSASLAAMPCMAGDDGSGVSLSAASPSVPPGGTLQMQVFMTEPKPILKGKQGLKSGVAAPQSTSPLGPVRDAAIFSSAGDVSGVAVIGSASTQFFFSSPLETFGTSTDTPVITLAYPVNSNAVLGQLVDLTLDPSVSLWLDPSGKPYPVELKSGVMTVGGTMSISDVVPGAGIIPAGTLISIKGVGFEEDSKVDFGEAKVATSQFLSPNLIQVTLRDSVEIRGQRIRIDNPNNERVEYFPYQRTTRIGKSTHALVAAGYPLFSQTAQTLGYFRPTLHGTVFSGLALQNLNSTTVTATLQLYSKTGTLLSTRNLVLATNGYISRDLVELFPGFSPTDGTRLKVTAKTGIQMLGLLGDDSSGTLLPVPPTSKP